jgi:hypothetical protein
MHTLSHDGKRDETISSSRSSPLLRLRLRASSPSLPLLPLVLSPSFQRPRITSEVAGVLSCPCDSVPSARTMPYMQILTHNEITNRDIKEIGRLGGNRSRTGHHIQEILYPDSSLPSLLVSAVLRNFTTPSVLATCSVMLTPSPLASPDAGPGPFP